MKTLLGLMALLCLITTHETTAQTAPAIGKITGLVQDQKSKAAIEFATVSILQVTDSTLITGTVTDEKGAFLIEKIPLGTYLLKMDFIGYKSQLIGPVAFSATQPVLQQPTTFLSINAENLETAEVTADQNMMQLGIDRKIFNVEKDQLTKGGTATDVLRNTPTLSVDMDGVISLRGSQGVTVLINGKPSALTGANRKAVLDQIPASMIKQVEIITNPSAKYDPEGVSGIINIVLKKNNLEGISTNVSYTVGTLGDKHNAALGFNYRNKKINLYSNYNFNYGRRWKTSETNRKNIYADSSSYLNQTSNGVKGQQTHFAKVGMDYYINDKNTLTLSAGFTPQTWFNCDTIDYQFLDNSEALTTHYRRDGIEDYKGFTMEYNLNYTAKFKQPKQELVFDATYSNFRGSSNDLYQEHFYNSEGVLLGNSAMEQTNQKDDGNDVLNAQVDYTHPFAKISGKLEVGAKGTLRIIDNDFESYNLDYQTNENVLNIGLSNHFQYNEQVYAVYGTYGQKIKKFSFQVGLRLEQAFTASKLVNTGEVYRNKYFSFYPSAHLSYQLPKMQQLQLSYSRRVNRPNIWALNPFISYTDPLNLQVGNPFLKPEYTHSVELSYAKYWKKGSFSASAYYKYTTDVIRKMFFVDNAGVGRVEFTNFDNTQSYGVEIVSGLQLFKWWRLNASANVYRMQEDGSNLSDNFRNDAIWGHGSIGSTFNLPLDFSAQLNVFYRSPLKLAIGTVSDMVHMSFGVSKSFLKRSLTISVRVTDPFRLQRFDYDLYDTNYTTSGKHRWESLVGHLSVSYNFGKMDMKTRQKMNKKAGNAPSGGGMGGF
ncbi:MAG: TonB-dependent receptor [Aureispira sp.]|nr:TonB-dependent receptor [Aureispira sp.]